MTNSSFAQTLDPQKMAAVMSVINMYLLAGRELPIDEPVGDRVDITINELKPDPYLVTDAQAIYAAFDLQDESVEFCFDVSSNIPLEAGDIVVEINGEVVTAIEGKDNCFDIPLHIQRDINYILITVVTPGITLTLDRIELLASAQSQIGLPILTRGGWDEMAVRKVIKIFAFGGHASDSQIVEWSYMYAKDAILEMLTFAEHNLKLSPLAIDENYPDTATQYGKLFDFATLLGDETANIPIPVDSRSQYGVDGYNFDDGFGRMITVRGLNPFRQRIGFWETNYHLATNLDASVSRQQMTAYYDLIMEAHESGVPYYEVMGVAAKSAAVAMQYGHRRNEWVYDSELDEFVCDCNEDFAREIHQLFYGIFGVDDPNHEDVTIPETAKMLTDISVDNINGFGFDLVVDFQTDDHHVADVLIFDQNFFSPVSGADARAKIDDLMPKSMQHPESLENLPVMIISVLADDNLNESRKVQLRAAWASMGVDRNLLEFIQTYAISDLFHGPSHFKYLTSHERALYMANKNNLDNLEAFFGGASYSGRAGRSVGGVVGDDLAGDFFKPIHNVFGGQTSFEAADSALVFENNYNILTDDEFRMRDAVACDTCDNGQPWEKKWPDVLPQRTDGQYYVADVAEWLWNHAVGNLDNYTELEKAHLYSLLGAVRINPGSSSDGDNPFDFNLLMCMVDEYKLTNGSIDIVDLLTGSHWDDYCRQNDDGFTGFSPLERAALDRVFTGQEISDDPDIQNVLSQLSQITFPFDDATGANGSETLRRHARERVNNALGFIFTTPFVFAEGK